MKKNITFMLLVSLFGLASSLFGAQQKSELDLISNRLGNIESHQSNLDERFRIKMENVDGKFNLKSKEIDSKLSEIDKRCNTFFEKVYFIGAPATLIGIILLFCAIWIKMYKIAETKVNEKFESMFIEKREKLVQLIKSQDEELNLKQNKSILVISPAKSDETFIRRFFQEMEFELVNFKRHGQQFDFTTDDLVLFNDETGEFLEDEITWYVETADKFICFYFGGKRINCIGYEHIFSFANSKLQLYGNIINALKYKKLVESV